MPFIFLEATCLLWGGIVFFIFDIHAFSSNSTDIVSSALIVIVIFSALIHFQKRKNTPASVSIILGASLGLAAATRLHIAFVVGFLVFLPLFFLTSKKNIFLMLSMALLSFCLFSPYLWQNPLKYLRDAFQALPYGSATIAQKDEYVIKLFDLFSEAPFAFMSAVTGLFLLFLPKEKISYDKKHIFFILMIVAVVGFLIYCANIPTLRYLYPMIFLLESFFIFFCANLLKIIFSKRNFFITKYAILISAFLMNIIPAIYLFIVWICFGPIDFEIFIFAMQIQFLAIILLFLMLQFFQVKFRKNIIKKVNIL